MSGFGQMLRNVALGTNEKPTLLGRIYGVGAVAAETRRLADFSAPIQKTETALWHETINPLRYITADKAALIYDRARLGCYADIAWLYQEIEAADPTLMVCAERRAAGLQETDWMIRTHKPERAGRAWSKSLADEQKAMLTEAYGACLGANVQTAQSTQGAGLLDGIEGLSTAFFRGFAHALPRYSADRSKLLAIETLDQWNFVRERATGKWLWNPNALSVIYGTELERIPDNELITLVRSRHIDYPALSIYLRMAMGEKQWGIFLERYGIPPVIIVMPEYVEQKDAPAFFQTANRVAKAGSGAVPAGTQIHYAAEARGQEPWPAFLRHQQELIVLLATGGVYTALAGGTGIGKGASEEHAETWRSIVRRDARIVAAALNRRVSFDLLNAQFPNQPHLAEFTFETETAPKPLDVFKDGATARQAGYRITQADLEARTGYQLTPEANTPPKPGSADSVDTISNKSPRTLNPEPSSDPLASAALSALQEARARDLAPIIDRLLAALEETDPQGLCNRLESLLQDLPGFVSALHVPQQDVDLISKILTDAVQSGAAAATANTNPVPV